MARSIRFRSLLLAIAVLLARPVGAEAIRVVVEPCSDLPQGDLSVVAWAEPERDGADPVVVEAAGRLGQPVELDLDAARSWRLSVESSAFWSEAGRPLDPVKETVVRLPAFPRAVLAGRLRVPRAERLPMEVVLRLGRTRGAAREEEPGARGSHRCSLEQAVVTCPVDDAGRFACPVPAGEWNVRLKAERWAGRHLWNMRLDPQHTREAGEIELRHGSTLLGEVTTIDGPADPRITRVHLEPVTSREPGRGTDPSIRRELAATARLNAQGFFVFEDLLPGAYTVVAHQPGYAPSAPLHVEVVENRETALREPIVLRPPLRLSVRITPAADPQGERWRLELARWAPSGEQLDIAASGRAEDDGRWEVEDLPPGRYRLEIGDGSGDPLVVEEPIVLEEDGQEIAIAIDVVEVSARVLIGDEALAGAEVWFGGRFGATRVHAVADEDGELVALLPRPGDWRVDVLSDDPRVVHEDRSVEVPEEGGELEIRLPDTRVRGRVIEEASGRPVAGSTVRAARADVRGGASGFVTDAEGRFEVLGLEAGSYLVQAEDEDARSPMVTIEVQEGVVPPELTLALARRRTVEGQVVSPHGGVPGARVEIVPLSVSGELVEMSVPSTVTDGSGRFAAELPAQAQEVLVTVLAPGFGLTLARTGVDGLRIAVAAPEGALRLARPTVEEGAAADASVELVLFGDLPVDVPTLSSWVAMHGGREGEGELVVPNLPAGTYRYCLARFEEALAVFTGRAVPTRCTGGILTPGGELRLAAP